VDISETYCDDYRIIGARYLLSPNGFGFDLVTSLPWSFNDLYAYKVVLSPEENLIAYHVANSILTRKGFKNINYYFHKQDLFLLTFKQY
jgi:hypothetical protein